jgi:hypothetical protein
LRDILKLALLPQGVPIKVLEKKTDWQFYQAFGLVRFATTTNIAYEMPISSGTD